MPQTVPTPLYGNGNFLVLVVPAIANTLAPTIAEVTAGTVIDISCYLTADGFATSINQNSIEDVRLCTKQIFEQPGDYSEELTLTYTYNTLSPANDKARIVLAEDALGHVLIRYGVDPEDSISVADKVDVYSHKAGKQQKNTPARNSPLTITQKMFLRDITRRDVAIVA